jgi:hypothetical protein
MSDRGHIWKTEREEYGYGNDDPATIEFPADEDDSFNSSGPCAGPMCKACHYHYCMHCHPDGPQEDCEPEE